MIIPIRCFTCGKVIAGLWETYVNIKNQYASRGEEVMLHKLNKKLQLKRYCCKRMLVTHVEIVDELLKYDRK